MTTQTQQPVGAQSGGVSVATMPKSVFNWTALGVVFGAAMGAGTVVLAYGRTDGAREVRLGQAEAKVGTLEPRVASVEADVKVMKVVLEAQTRVLEEVRQDVKALVRAQNGR